MDKDIRSRPKADTAATIPLKYEGAQTVIMPSWNWTFARKDLEIYGNTGEVMTVDTKKIQTRYKGEKGRNRIHRTALSTDRDNSLDYLAAVLHGTLKDQGLYGSLDTNVTVVQVMDAALEPSAPAKLSCLSHCPKRVVARCVVKTHAKFTFRGNSHDGYYRRIDVLHGCLTPLAWNRFHPELALLWLYLP
jgi:hypothetical protein